MKSTLKKLFNNHQLGNDVMKIETKTKWTPCGLNGDWNCEAYHYGENRPNWVDGDYYVLALEGDAGGEGYEVCRYYPSRDDGCTEMLTTEVFPSLASAKAFIHGIHE